MQGEEDFEAEVEPSPKVATGCQKVRVRPRADDKELSWLMRTSYINNDTGNTRQPGSTSIKPNEAATHEVDEDEAHYQRVQVQTQQHTNIDPPSPSSFVVLEAYACRKVSSSRLGELMPLTAELLWEELNSVRLEGTDKPAHGLKLYLCRQASRRQRWRPSTRGTPA